MGIKKTFIVFIVMASSLISGERVVCIHGFLRGKLSMEAISLVLKEENFEPLKWDYPSRKKTIAEHADDLVNFLNDLAEERPGEPISFVTHSLGGIILRAAVNKPNCPIEAREGKAILIAPPNKGSRFARKLGKSLLRKLKIFQERDFIEFCFGDKAGKELIETKENGFDRFGGFPRSMKILVIAGTMGYNIYLDRPNDGKVMTKETRLRSPHEYAEVYAGHSWITYHPQTLAKVSRFIRME